MKGSRMPGTLGPVLSFVLIFTAFLLVPGEGTARHHSLLAEFDPDRTIELTGIVTKVEWTNPHTYFYLDVRTGIGTTERWAWELASPNGLERHGWTADTIQVGDRITANGTPARDGSRKANTRTVLLRDGQKLSAALGDDNQ